ncbi:MAG: tyrosine-type recombinase/integrase [Sedimentisphaerales bacterium]
MARKKAKGWHLNRDKAPHSGKGSATVEPLRKKNDIAAIKGCLSNSPRDYALFTVGINMGLRGSDLLSLRFKDILTPDGHIKTALKVVEQKTDKCRRITIGDNVRKALEDLCHNSNENTLPNNYIFPSRKGGKMSIQRLHQLVNEWAKAANIEGHFGSHSLRKTYGHFQYKQGVDIALLMEIFGHSSQAITLRYIGIEQDDIDEANLRLNL